MRYADSLLADGEVVVRRARQHWFSVVVDGRRGWVLILVGLLALIAGLAIRNDEGAAGTLGAVLSIVALVALVLGLLLAGYQVLRWRAQDYVITNRRVVQVEGVLNKRAADSSLEKINDAVLDQNVLGRLFGYGDLDILTAAESAIDRFRMLAKAPDFKREMLNQKHALEMEVARPPSPALRADAAPVSRQAMDVPPAAPAGASGLPPQSGGSAASVAAAPAPPAPSGTASPAAAPTGAPLSDPGQVTATLARLADLRDRGAITAEEYETKKAELLSRL